MCSWKQCITADAVRLAVCLAALVVAAVLMLIGEPLPSDSPHNTAAVGYGLFLCTVGYIVGRGLA